jgi:hypothetical protein
MEQEKQRIPRPPFFYALSQQSKDHAPYPWPIPLTDIMWKENKHPNEYELTREVYAALNEPLY